MIGRLLLLVLLLPALAHAQPTFSDLETISPSLTGDWDFSGGNVRLPTATTCAAGDCDAAAEYGRVCVDSDATSGQQVYVCESGGWILQGDGGGGGGGGPTAAPTPNANTVYAGPTSGSATPAVFRALVDADIPNSITVDLATAATALAANGSNCSAGNYPLGVNASGAVESCTADDDVPESGDFTNLTAANVPTVIPTPAANTFYAGPTSGGATPAAWRTLVDADVPNTITVDLATAASALAANPSDCSANQFATTIAANGNLTCAAITDADVPNGITVDLATSASDLTCTNCIGATEITDLTLGTDTAGNYAAGDAEAGAALTGDSATSFFPTGTIEVARLPGTIVYNDQANTYSAGMKQSVDSTSTTAGFRDIGTTSDPSSASAGDRAFRTDLAGPPILPTSTATATFTPGGGVATPTATATATFTPGGGVATPTATQTASPTPTVTPTPVGRDRVRDSIDWRTAAAINDLLDLRQGGVLVQNGVDIASVNLDSADFAAPVCSGGPPTCTLALGSTVMRTSTAVQTSQMPTIAKGDDQDLCWGADADLCIRWVSASAWATFTGLVEFAGDVQLKKETDHTISVLNSTSTNTSGGSLTIRAANGAGVSNGGSVSIVAGSGLGQGNISLIPSGFDGGNINLTNTTSGVIAFNAEKAATLTQGRRTTSNTAGVATTLLSGGATSGATDKAAGDLSLGCGISTGTGNCATRIQGRAKAASTGTSDNSVTDRIVSSGVKSVTDGSLTGFVDINIPSGAIAGGTVMLTCEATNGTDRQATSTQLTFSGVNKAGTMTCTGTELGADVTAASTGTFTVAVDATTGTNKCVLRVNCDTSLTPSSGYPRVSFTVMLNSGFAATASPL